MSFVDYAEAFGRIECLFASANTGDDAKKPRSFSGYGKRPTDKPCTGDYRTSKERLSPAHLLCLCIRVGAKDF